MVVVVVQVTTLSLPTRVEVELGCDNMHILHNIVYYGSSVDTTLFAQLALVICLLYLYALEVRTPLRFSYLNEFYNVDHTMFIYPYANMK